MSLYVVNVCDLDLITPCKIYEGVGFNFDTLYSEALEAIMRAKLHDDHAKLVQHFAKYRKAMKRGGYMYAESKTPVEIYSTVYNLNVLSSHNRRRVDRDT